MPNFNNLFPIEAEPNSRAETTFATAAEGNVRLNSQGGKIAAEFAICWYRAASFINLIAYLGKVAREREVGVEFAIGKGRKFSRCCLKIDHEID